MLSVRAVSGLALSLVHPPRSTASFFQGTSAAKADDPSAGTRVSPNASWSAILDLPGIKYAWISAGASQPSPQAARSDGAEAVWAKLQMALAGRIAEELELGKPRVLVTVHDRQLLVLGLADHAQVALILNDPSSAGMAMLRVKAWIEHEHRCGSSES